MTEQNTSYHDSQAESSQGQRMQRLIRDLFPICRSITGDGVRATLRGIGQWLPIEIREVPSGTRVFDWEIPAEWNIRDAYIESPDGRKVVDFRQSNLHVVSYSRGQDRRVGWDELRSHLHSLPDHPFWIPYRTSYYHDDWGFCVPHQVLQSLEPGEYRVWIDADHNPAGSLTYGELFLPGASPHEILFSCHICHPSLANDNLSSLAVAVELAMHLAKIPRRYSYRFLFAPGTIGAITWLANNPTPRNSIVAGLVLALLGDDQHLTYKKTRFGNARVDRIVEYVLRQCGSPFEMLPFTPFGYDERQFGSQGMELPIGRLSRSVEGGYPEYHTSADNLDLVQTERLEQALQTLVQVVEAFEQDSFYRTSSAGCEPQLGRRGLYPVRAARGDAANVQRALMWNLTMSDGSTGLREIAACSQLPLEVHQESADILVENGLLHSVSWDTGLGLGGEHGRPSGESVERSRRAHRVIPGGAHTYAKGDDQFPVNAPRFFERGQGCIVQDSDGNRFIEYGMGLRSVSLGHAFPPVVDAAYRQMQMGSNFTRPSTIELEVAEQLLELLPAADMVKFTKNGSDATTAAIRLARAKTGRNKVFVCADHPFFSVDDWFIGTTAMDAGIPQQAVEPVIRFPYNNLAALEALLAEHAGQIACLIMEAATYQEPSPGYLQGVQALCQREGILFILDEMITGFRWNIGGAQAEYGLQPDLSTFGKALGNGFSVAALAGKREHMELGGLHHDQPRVFLLSYTHGAETHCLAAAQATIRTYQEQPVIETLYRRGSQLREGLTEIARELGVQKQFYVMGRPCNLIFVTLDVDGRPSQGMRTLLLQELIKKGIFAPSLVVSYSHGDREIETTLAAFRLALGVYRRALDEGLEPFLLGRPSKPVFRRLN